MTHVHVEVVRSIRTVVVNSPKIKDLRGFSQIQKWKKNTIRYVLDTFYTQFENI